MANRLRALEREMGTLSAQQKQGGFRSQQNARQQERSQRGSQSTTAESDSNGSDNETTSQSEGSSRKTPSEYSLPTPEDDHFQPEIDQFYFGMDSESATFPVHNVATMKTKQFADDGTVGQKPLGFLEPLMLASLTSHHDLNYDRFSTFLDAGRLPTFQIDSEEGEEEGEEESDSDLEFDDEDMYSPIEIAKPVAIATLRQRPAVVSISSPRSATFPRSVHEDLARRSMESRSSRRSSLASSVDARNSTYYAASAAMPTSTSYEPSRWSDDDDGPVKREDDIGQYAAYPRRVSSVPSAAAASSRSSRMNSLKNFIRSTSSQLIDIKEETSTSSRHLARGEHATQPKHYNQPGPGRAVTRKQLNQDLDLGAFITSPPVSRRSVDLSAQADEPHLVQQRKRSFTSLRSRSGSIGESLQHHTNAASAATSTNTHTTIPPVPALPHLTIPTRSTSKRYSREVVTLQPAPVIAPRNPRRTLGTYSAFPTADRVPYRASTANGTLPLRAM